MTFDDVVKFEEQAGLRWQSRWTNRAAIRFLDAPPGDYTIYAMSTDGRPDATGQIHYSVATAHVSVACGAGVYAAALKLPSS